MYVVEWSCEQNSFHVQTVELMLQANREAFATNTVTQFIPLHFFETRDQATEMCEKLRAARPVNDSE